MLPKPELPEDAEPLQLTVLLQRMQQGDQRAGEQAVELVYRELHQIAARELRREKPGHTLVPTALMHEAYLRLAGPGSVGNSESERNWGMNKPNEGWPGCKQAARFL